jgi:hypothetical protein
MSLVGTPDYSAPEVLKTGVYRLSSKGGGGGGGGREKGPDTDGCGGKEKSAVPDNIG